MWVARDKDGHLYIFKRKPIKDKIVNKWVTEDISDVDFDYLEVQSWVFSEVKWSDSEPTEIILKKRLCG